MKCALNLSTRTWRGHDRILAMPASRDALDEDACNFATPSPTPARGAVMRTPGLRGGLPREETRRLSATCGICDGPWGDLRVRDATQFQTGIAVTACSLSMDASGVCGGSVEEDLDGDGICVRH